MPISIADLELYRRYDGDMDGASRSSERGSSVPEASWRVIDDLRQRAFLVAVGHASEGFAARLGTDLAAVLPDAEARRAFQAMVDQDLASVRRPEHQAAQEVAVGRKQKLFLLAAMLATIASGLAAASMIGKEVRAVELIALFAGGFGAGASVVAALVALRATRRVAAP